MPYEWPRGKFRLFISHLSKYRSDATELANHLNSYAIFSFIAHKDIKVSTEWEKQITSALKTTHTLVALLHEDFHKSHWCDQEVGYAMGRKKHLILVKRGTTPYGFMGKLQAISASNSLRQVASKIVIGLVEHRNTCRPMARTIGRALRECGWDDVRKFTDLAEKVLEGGERAGTLLNSAIKANRDIKNEKYKNCESRLKSVAKKWLMQPEPS